MLLCVLCFAGMIQAAAKTVNAVTLAKTVTGGKWVSSKKGKKYQYSDGSYAKSTWLNVKGNIYRIKKNGVRATGWFTVGGKDFYASKTGKVYIKRWLKKGSSRYYFQGTGICAKKKWVKIDGNYYYFLKSGKMAKDRMVSKDGKYYYVDASGVRVKASWVERKGKKYYFDGKGVRLQNTWMMSEGNLYYFGSNGAMAVNTWVDNTYYVGADGARMKDCFVDGYYLDTSGRKVPYTQNYIFVGDSRMVGMQQSVVGNDVHYIAEIGQGYDWLKATGGEDLKYCLRYKPNVTVVLALGVNDMGNIDNYISYYQALMKEFPLTRFYLLSVNPLDDELAKSKGFAVRNKQVTAFNKKLKAAFAETMYIDSHSFLMQDGNMQTFDGVHYTVDTYKLLYDFVMKSIGGIAA